MKPQALTFEQAFAQLEAIVAKLESGNLPLEESVVLYEEGMCLAQLCGQRLDGAELRVSRLTSGENGQVTEIPLDPDTPAEAKAPWFEEIAA